MTVLLNYGKISKTHCILRRLLESGTYSDLSVNDATLIRERRLFEARCLSEEIRYLGFLSFLVVFVILSVSPFAIGK